MHFGFLALGLISGGTAAIAAFSYGANMTIAILAYSFFGFGAVCFSAVIWAMAPEHSNRIPFPVRRSIPRVSPYQ